MNTRCKFCDGTGICRCCEGSGAWECPNCGHEIDGCDRCDGSGNCWECDGSGIDEEADDQDTQD